MLRMFWLCALLFASELANAASPTPEAGPLTLTGIGLVALVLLLRRKRE